MAVHGSCFGSLLIKTYMSCFKFMKLYQLNNKTQTSPLLETYLPRILWYPMTSRTDNSHHTMTVGVIKCGLNHRVHVNSFSVSVAVYLSQN